jgi:hypothetical protein
MKKNVINLIKKKISRTKMGENFGTIIKEYWYDRTSINI